MHLLAAKPGTISDGSEAVDLGQTPGDIVVFSAADTELACLAQARAGLPDDAPSLRLANLLFLAHNLSVDKYLDDVVQHAKLVVVRLLGGVRYWPYGVEELSALCRERGIALAVLPGDDQPDPELTSLSILPPADAHRLWQYCVQGGPDNARNLLLYAGALIGRPADWREPATLLRAGLYWPGLSQPTLHDLRRHWQSDRPVAAIVFYRAVLQSGDLAAIDALIAALAAAGLNALPVYAASLKEPVAADLLRDLLGKTKPSIVLNATAFALSQPGTTRSETPFDAAGCPVLQVVFASGTEESWRAGTNGLSARDIAMHVALPEVDGRILSRAIAFKAEQRRDPLTQCSVVTYRPLADRVSFVAQLATAWTRLRTTPPSERRIGLILANYPNRDGRIGNGVGLDTPAGTIEVLRALDRAGYTIADAPADGAALMRLLLSGPTNQLETPPPLAGGGRGRGLVPAGAGESVHLKSESDEQGETGLSASYRAQTPPPTPSRKGRGGTELTLSDYRTFFASLPERLRTQVADRWSEPERDPFFAGGAFHLPIHRFGNIVVGIQPARGYNIDPAASYHSPDLVPPHGYLAFYAWLRRCFDVHAIVHMGKHGNLEWLPGKALALSEECWPEAALGPLPHLYPFIVNDPGEGAQAKRRSAAVIVDHLTPPLTRAETYGPLRDLEQLVDEYYEAAGLDPRRCRLLRDRILELAASIGLDRDCGVTRADDQDAALGKLDNHLCELKELQIRDGLHIFGVSPVGEPLADLLVALTRLPRGRDEGRDASLLRALSRDLGLDFDPLTAALGDPWSGPRPAALCDSTQGFAIHDTQQDVSRLSGHPPPYPPPPGGREFAGALGDYPSPLEGEGRVGGRCKDTLGVWRTNGDTVERLELLAKHLIDGMVEPRPEWTATRAVLDFINDHLRPTVAACGDAEIAGLLAGLDGRFVAPGPSGAPSRGRLDVLPTGRNFYSVDTRTVPTPTAWQLGWKSAALLLERYRQDHGAWPKSLALSAWGTANMRTGGDDIAQALALMGVRPTWDTGSGRVSGFEILPLSILDRPRVDVTLRISGFFRDAFPAQIDLFDSAARAVAALDEPEDDNPMAARVRRDAAAMTAAGIPAEAAAKRAGFRVFGSKPGAYGAGLQALIDERGWETAGDLARAYVAWGGYAYGAGAQGAAEHRLFQSRLAAVEGVLHNQDNREHDLLDSDDYYQFEGGLAAAVKELSGRRPAVYHNDHARPESPRIRSLEEEIARVVRARVVNPKWIRGVMRHGYKGVFEMAATVDYMFAFAATAGCVADHHFDAVFDAYVADAAVRDFMLEHNAPAAREMAERLLEAQDRGLWRPRSNFSHARLRELAAVPN
jgi:cobaltochelatase CobN